MNAAAIEATSLSSCRRNRTRPWGKKMPFFQSTEKGATQSNTTKHCKHPVIMLSLQPLPLLHLCGTACRKESKRTSVTERASEECAGVSRSIITRVATWCLRGKATDAAIIALQGEWRHVPTQWPTLRFSKKSSAFLRNESLEAEHEAPVAVSSKSDASKVLPSALFRGRWDLKGHLRSYIVILTFLREFFWQKEQTRSTVKKDS